MIHQRVSHGEESCFGEDPEYGTLAPKKKYYRYNWRIVWKGIALSVTAAAGALLDRFASGDLSRDGAIVFFVSAILVAGFIADPLIASLNARRRRKKMYAVK